VVLISLYIRLPFFGGFSASSSYWSRVRLDLTGVLLASCRFKFGDEVPCSEIEGGLNFCCAEARN
jgi:hypothetical protein